MDIVIDTSALLAVIVGQPERERVIELTAGHTIIGPGSIPWEVGNAFSAMMKQKRITLEDARKGMQAFDAIPIRYVPVEMERALALAHQLRMYAYDAYVLDCALRHNAPILTLDRKLKDAARTLKMEPLEV